MGGKRSTFGAGTLWSALGVVVLGAAVGILARPEASDAQAQTAVELASAQSLADEDAAALADVEQHVAALSNAAQKQARPYLQAAAKLVASEQAAVQAADLASVRVAREKLRRELFELGRIVQDEITAGEPPQQDPTVLQASYDRLKVRLAEATVAATATGRQAATLSVTSTATALEQNASAGRPPTALKLTALAEQIRVLEQTTHALP